MDESSLRMLVNEREHRRLEFKRDLSGKKPQAICKEIAAFATTKGGTLLIGVDDDGAICGVSDPEKIASKIENWIVDCIDPPVAADVRQVVCTEGVVIAVIVDRGAAPFYLYDGCAYTRGGSSSRPMRAQEIAQAVRDPIQTKVHALENELSQLRSAFGGASRPRSLTWRPKAIGTRGMMYLEAGSVNIDKLVLSVRAVGGVQSVRIDRRGQNRSVIAVELPASAEFVQRSIADRAIAAALLLDPTISLEG